jgi:hypothetical protein
MAITNAQQYKQLFAKGGRIGLKGGADAATASFGKSVGYSGPSRDDPKGGFDLSGGQGPTFEGAPASQLSQDVINREKEYRDFIQAFNKKPPFVGPAASILRNIVPGNKKLRSQFINQKLQNEKIKDFYENLPEEEQDNFNVMQGLAKVGYDQYAADMGSPGLLYSGNVGGLEKYVTGEDEFGNTTYGYRGGRDGGNQLLPITPYQQDIVEQEPELTELQQMLADRGPLARRFAADGGIMNPNLVGGMMDGGLDEMGRQMYGFGKLVKKATRAVKKIVKSPIGKAALAYGITGGLGNLAAGKGFGSMFSNFLSPSKFLSTVPGIFSKSGIQNIASRVGLGSFKNTGGQRLFEANKLGSFLGSPIGMITAASALPLLGLGTGDESEEEAQVILDQSGIDIADIRANPNKYLARRFAAEGGSMKEPVAKKTMPLLDMDGMEKDYRAEGGFVPIGRMEKADDVPARLSKNEFVFTADAVRNAGDGNVDKGAEVMYNMMKNLEAGGDVSEESQGLDGARKMFQTSQRLEEVL